MKEIPLTQGKVALVDDEDFDFLNQWKWYPVRHRHTFYVKRYFREEGKRTVITMHRVLLNAPAEMEVDHIDGDGLNNTKANLRLCTGHQNQGNARKRNNTSSKYRGVSVDRRSNKWNAKIGQSLNSVNKAPQKYLGYFDTEEEAALAYNWGALEYFGEFARLNEIGIVPDRRRK